MSLDTDSWKDLILGALFGLTILGVIGGLKVTVRGWFDHSRSDR